MDTGTTGIYTLSLHDALPISNFSALGSLNGSAVYTPSTLVALSTTSASISMARRQAAESMVKKGLPVPAEKITTRSEEHTSELQSRPQLVCRLLLEKKKQIDQCSEHVIGVEKIGVKKDGAVLNQYVRRDVVLWQV